MAKKTLKLTDIGTDGELQARVAMSQEVIDQYAEAIEDGAEMPPLQVVFDGTEYWLWDGYHTLGAYHKVGVGECECNVTEGTKRDGKLLSLKANDRHGLQRTNEDKRNSVATCLRDAEWSKWSDAKIAEACGVSQQFVSKFRKDAQPTTVVRCHNGQDGEPSVEWRVGRDGRTRRVPAKRKPKESPKTPSVDELLGDAPVAEAAPVVADAPSVPFEPAPEPGPVAKAFEKKEAATKAASKHPSAAAFAECDKFDQLAKDISAIKQRVKGLGEGPARRFLSLQVIESDLDGARNSILYAKPHAECPVKTKDHSNCHVCKGSFFITKEAAKRIDGRKLA